MTSKNESLEIKKQYLSHISFAQRLANSYAETGKLKIKQTSNVLACINLKSNVIKLDVARIFDGVDAIGSMMAFKGLLFHEVHHYLYPLPHQMGKSRIPTSILNVSNMLEDGRIETLGVLTHSKLADYFRYPVLKYVVSNEYLDLTKSITTYILLFGRRLFIDAEIVAKYRAMLLDQIKEELVEKLENYIQDYTFKDSIRGRWLLAEKVSKLFESISFPSVSNNVVDRGSGKKSNKPSDINKNRKTKAQKHLEKIVDKIKKESLKSCGKSDQSKEGVQKKLDELEKKRNELSDIATSTSDKKIHDEAMDDLRDINVQKELLLNQTIKIVPKNILDKLTHSIGESLIKTEKENKTDLDTIGVKYPMDDVGFNPSAEMYVVANDIARQMKKMNLALKSAYKSRCKSGKLNLRSYINRATNQMNIFDKYTPSKYKGNRMLINIFLDVSGSMGTDVSSGSSTRYDLASQSTWAINKAMQKSGKEVKVRVTGFGSSTYKLKEYDGELNLPLRADDGHTRGSEAILETIDSCEAYRKKQRYPNVMDIIITDGNFDLHNQDKHTGERGSYAISQLIKRGHETVMISIGRDYGKKGCKHYKVLCGNEINQLPSFLSDVVARYRKSVIRVHNK